MKRTVFLDRDGVINENVDHLSDVAALRIIDGVPEAIKDLNERGYQVVVVTNQAGIAKGLITKAALAAIHAEIGSRLASAGARIDGIYHCPHHPDGDVAEYAIVCACRKPGTGMIEQAVRELEVDLAGSFLVGDKVTDIAAGKKMGLRTILVGNDRVGSEDLGVEPDLFAKDLREAVRYM